MCVDRVDAGREEAMAMGRDHYQRSSALDWRAALDAGEVAFGPQLLNAGMG